MEIQRESLKKCPKCQTLNRLEALECKNCQVVFSRLKNLPLDPRLRVSPRLVRAWQEVLIEFENPEKHFEFIRLSDRLNANSFALKKYEDLLRHQPFDDYTKKMYDLALLTNGEPAGVNPSTQNLRKGFNGVVASHSFHQETLDWILQFSKKIPWKKVLRNFPVAVGGGVIILGLCLPHLRNLVGIGAAIAFITLVMGWGQKS